MKKVITELNKEAVSIIIYAGDNEPCIINLPVDLIAPQISLQIAGMIASDPTLPRKHESTSAE